MVSKNKRGQDLSIGTLILIVLGIIVLVLLILGFTMGWDNLWGKINIFGGSTTRSDVVNACKLAASSQDTYTFCSKTFEIKEKDVDGKMKPVTLKCSDVDSLLVGVTKLDCPPPSATQPPAVPAIKACTGNPKACNTYTGANAASLCAAAGCTWNTMGLTPACTGSTPKACNTYTGTNAEQQCTAAGCSWA
jgi:hypothetical protein